MSGVAWSVLMETAGGEGEEVKTHPCRKTGRRGGREGGREGGR